MTMGWAVLLSEYNVLDESIGWELGACDCIGEVALNCVLSIRK